MRFDSFTLEKYGRFEKLSPAPLQPGLVVIYGPNEAGKSTCLSAISDFLFGIEARSEYSNSFGGPAMRLEAALTLASGRELTLRRRKGTGRTLTDASGNPVDEGVLSNVLGSTTRERFEALFGLNHQTLREGGDRLLRSDGDIGRLIVEAGGGLRTLVSRMEQLSADSAKLFSTRKSGSVAYYQALEEFNSAESDCKAALKTREGHEQARTLLAAAEAEYAAVKARGEELSVSLRRLAAQISLDEAEQALVLLQQQIEALAPPPGLLESEALIRDIFERSIHVGNERRSHPKRVDELVEQQSKLASLRQSIELAPEADLEPLVPRKLALDNLQRLANIGIQLNSKIETLTQQIEAGEKDLATLTIRQDKRAAQGYRQPFGIAAADLKPLPKLAQQLASRTSQRDSARQEIERRLAAAHFVSIGGVRAWRCPDAAVIQAELDRRVSLEKTLAQHIETTALQTARRDAAQAEIARLQTGGEVPTDAAIANSRAARQAAWEPIRGAFLAATPLAAEERTEAVSHFERRTDAADRLADRKSTEAQRITDLAAAEKQLLEARAALQAIAEASRTTQETLERCRQEFAASWPEAVAKTAELGPLKALVAERAAIIEMLDKAARIDEECEPLRAEHDPKLDDLVRAEQQLRIDVAATLTARIQAVVKRIEAHENEYAAYRNDAAALDQLQDQLRRQREALAKLLTEKEAWLAEWLPAVRETGRKDEIAPEQANQIVSEWSAARGTLESIRTTRKRLAQFDRDGAELAALIGRVAANLAFALPEDAVAAAKMLQQRLDEARAIEAKRNGLQPQLAQRTAERDAKRRAAELASGEPTVQDLNAIIAEKARIESELQAHRATIEAAHAVLLERRRELDAFESSAGMNAAAARRERAIAKMHQTAEQYLDLTLAHVLLEEAVGQLRQQSQDPLLARAGELFALSTRGAFSGIAADIDEKGVPVVTGRRTGGGGVATSHMSDGTRDQLFLAFRIASIEQYCAAAEPLPFIADDLLVHFDDERSAATLNLLRRLAETTQVLLFTHHASVRDMAGAPVATLR
jgi:uncharacterized protein YhaN